MEQFLVNEYNPHGLFVHPQTNQATDLAFTGGEPMLQQKAMRDILLYFIKINNYPKSITIETNGTKEIKPEFAEIVNYIKNYEIELFWSCSPKLYLSGENWNQAIKPHVLSGYNKSSSSGQLKYVVDGSERAWDEVAKATELYREQGVMWPVWIMPVAAKKEDQEKHQAYICEETIKRGYNFAARVHCWIFSNVVGK